MPSISVPRRPQSNQAATMQLIGTGVGAGLGAMAGGVGAAPGAAMGSSIGGALGGASQANQPAGPQALETGPMSRRLEKLDQSPLRQIRDSIDSLKYVDDDATRMELAKPLVMAEMKAKRNPLG